MKKEKQVAVRRLAHNLQTVLSLRTSARLVTGRLPPSPPLTKKSLQFTLYLHLAARLGSTQTVSRSRPFGEARCSLPLPTPSAKKSLQTVPLELRYLHLTQFTDSPSPQRPLSEKLNTI